MNGCYGHVNFTAKANQENSKEELFFAELRFHHNTYIATCVLSLEGDKISWFVLKSISPKCHFLPCNFKLFIMFLILFSGGLCGSKYDNGKNGFFFSMLSIAMLVGVD